ncbi:MAG: DegT/DnrJ/EryC1/StrS family aminotransferase [Elusimicrobiota bacterium]
MGWVRISPRARRYVRKVLADERLSYGPFLRRFENGFASLHGTRWAVTCNSGTSALHVAIAALQARGRWKPGDEALVPAVTFVATANMAVLQGLKPVFVDVHPRTYNMDPGQVERHITRRTRLMIPAHLFGQPADMGPLMRIARRHNLKVVEDSCETMFARYHGRSVGSFGHVGCFSTYAAHLLVTGVGGLAVTSSPPLAVALRSLVNHGRDSIYLSIDDDAARSRLREVVARRFRFVRMGFSYRLTEMEGALGLAQLEERDAMLKKRRRNAAYLLRRLRPYEEFLQLPWWPDGVDHSFMMFPIVLSARVSKARLTLFLEKRGVETRDMLPLINQPYYVRMFGDLEKRYPVARRINRGGFYIGCHPGLGRAELDHVIDSFDTFFRRFRRRS